MKKLFGLMVLTGLVAVIGCQEPAPAPTTTDEVPSALQGVTPKAVEPAAEAKPEEPAAADPHGGCPYAKKMAEEGGCPHAKAKAEAAAEGGGCPYAKAKAEAAGDKPCGCKGECTCDGKPCKCDPGKPCDCKGECKCDGKPCEGCKKAAGEGGCGAKAEGDEKPCGCKGECDCGEKGEGEKLPCGCVGECECDKKADAEK
jgi:hypothetical protein